MHFSKEKRPRKGPVFPPKNTLNRAYWLHDSFIKYGFTDNEKIHPAVQAKLIFEVG